MAASETDNMIQTKDLDPKDKQIISETIADIAHQLRTPLTTINILISLIQGKDISEDAKRDYLQQINKNLAHLEWLITALLRISKIDAGTADFRKDTVYLSDLVGETAQPLMIPMELRKQVFDFACSGRESFIGDINWSKEALCNILKNCMEHTPEGGYISVAGKETDEYTEIIVTDTGSGIDPKDLPHIFERYYRGHNSNKQGSGIGLALSKMIIEKQNGKVSVENRPQGGARFDIKFFK